MGEGGKQAGGGQQQEERRKLVKAGVEKGDLVREQQAAPDYFWFHRWRPLFLVCRPAATSTLSSPGQKFTVAEFEARKKRRVGALRPKVKTRGGRFRRFRRILELTPRRTRSSRAIFVEYASSTARWTRWLECYCSKLGPAFPCSRNFNFNSTLSIDFPAVSRIAFHRN